MRHHSGSRRGFASAQRRKLVWATTSGSLSTVPTGAGTLIDLLSGYRAAGGTTQGITIIRTHAQFATAAPLSGLTSADGVGLGLIIGNGTESASTLNNQDFFLDWMLRRELFSASATSLPNNTAAAAWDIDLRAKRKVEELNQTYWMSVNAIATATPSFSYFVKVLLALP